MTIPFPGMDPFLEAPHLWPDVHNSLIYATRSQIQSQLSPNYVAVITPYVTFESLEITPVRTAVAIPYVGILESDVSSEHSTTVTIAPAPLQATATMEVPTRYARLEIRTVEDGVLITAIEVLSPANKRSGADGADAYEKKRQELFRSEAHLLEIDLLRNGQRPRFATTLPDNSYFVFLGRAEYRPQFDVWPLSLREAIPRIPVPLRRLDPDVVLDLTAALQQIYTNARYERRINYRDNPPPPILSEEDATWLDAHLHERGLRW
ncbi:MAG: DUF4058 family protein [Chloroflexota bacterium]